MSGIPISKRLVFVNATSGIVARVINLALLLWLQRYLLTRITMEEYGLYPVMVSIITFALLIKTLMSSGVARYVAYAKARNDTERIESIGSTIFALTAIVGLISLVLGGLFSVNIHRVLTVAPGFETDAMIMMLVLVMSFSVRVVFSPFEIGLMVDQRFVLLNLIEIGIVAVRILLLVGLLLGVSTRVIWVAVATEAANVGGVLARTLLSRRYLPELRFTRGKYDREVARELLSFGGWSFVGQIAYRIRTSADSLVLNELGTSFDVTVFYLGSMLLKQLTTVTAQIAQTVLPGITAMHATDQGDRLGNTFVRYGRLMLLTFLSVSVPLIVFRREVFTFYVGEAFVLAGSVLLLLMASESLSRGYALLYSLAVAKARVRFLAIVGLCLQVSNLALTIVLVGQFNLGALGSALSSAIFKLGVEPLIVIPYALGLADVTFGTWIKHSVLRGFLPGLIVAALLVVTRLVWPPETVVVLILELAAGFVGYWVVAYFVGFEDSDRRDFGQIVLRRRSVFRDSRS
ncbi:MAG: lipopolysaccharide biosynthesis protein [bacterium]